MEIVFWIRRYDARLGRKTLKCERIQIITLEDCQTKITDEYKKIIRAVKMVESDRILRDCIQENLDPAVLKFFMELGGELHAALLIHLYITLDLSAFFDERYFKILLRWAKKSPNFCANQFLYEMIRHRWRMNGDGVSLVKWTMEETGVESLRDIKDRIYGCSNKRELSILSAVCGVNTTRHVLYELVINGLIGDVNEPIQILDPREYRDKRRWRRCLTSDQMVTHHHPIKCSCTWVAYSAMALLLIKVSDHQKVLNLMKCGCQLTNEEFRCLLKEIGIWSDGLRLLKLYLDTRNLLILAGMKKKRLPSDLLRQLRTYI